ncbi:MAG: biopolymer transport protein ExbB [Gallionellaceae bacterium]|nr:MAG: biopolymer transport protein ExbB [Gallionellaceae bacterium]
MMMRNLLNLMAAVLLVLPALVYAEWSPDWTVHQKITVNAQAASGVVEQVPAAVRLHSGNFNFIAARPDGSDLRFIADDDKTELAFHIEKFDSVNELAVIWVQLPKVDPKDKDAHFWLYYGNEKAAAPAGDRKVPDASAVAVFHFAAKSLLQDSAASGLTASGEIAVQKAALLGEAALFGGKPITVPAVKSGGAGFTWSAWIKPAAIPQQAVLFGQNDVGIRLDGQKLALIAGKAALSGGEIKPAAWQHLAVTVEAGKATLYVNGAAVGSGEVALAEVQADAVVGKDYTGEMDELQLANVARSADWIKLAASGQGADSQLLAVHDAENGEEGGESDSYIGILVNSLTLDAKIVIGILAVMFAVSAAVMAAKARLISRTDQDNRQFLDRFQGASQDLLQLDSGGSLPDSTLYKLYMAGLREIRKREKQGEALALGGASMDAIKAAIDADLVRETRRINDKMVLLTIAISGGPFLGLLGTVVGVMITFAAIAAAGDVNVNAIAPGIAAALLATVAGLAVAIPALFGYNYLASRIKNITIEMQIFVDEFVTRVAELHGK